MSDGGGLDSEQDSLLLRLRVAELERGIEEAWAQVATQSTTLDDVRRTLRWRSGELLRRARRAVREDVCTARQADVPRIPLAGLHAQASGGSGPRWRDEVVVDGVALPGLLADPPQELSWRVIPSPGFLLRTFCALRPAGWMRNAGGVRFTASVFGAEGEPVRAVSRVVDPAARHEDRVWRLLELDLNGLAATEHRLVLRTDLPDGTNGVYAWAVWGDPVLLDRPASPPPSLPAALADEARGVLERRFGPAAPSPGRPVDHPVISLLVPVHDPDPALLDALLDSVRAQTSPHWQLCLCDDGSRDPEVRRRLRDAGGLRRAHRAHPSRRRAEHLRGHERRLLARDRRLRRAARP